MSRPTDDEELIRVHIWIYKRDHERIMAYFDKTLGFSRAARMMLRKFLDNLEAQSAATAKPIKAQPNDPDPKL